jgi:hypothetical protein
MIAAVCQSVGLAHADGFPFSRSAHRRGVARGGGSAAGALAGRLRRPRASSRGCSPGASGVADLPAAAAHASHEWRQPESSLRTSPRARGRRSAGARSCAHVASGARVRRAGAAPSSISGRIAREARRGRVVPGVLRVSAPFFGKA